MRYCRGGCKKVIKRQGVEASSYFWLCWQSLLSSYGWGRGGSPLSGVGGYVLLNRVRFSGSSVVYNFTITVTGVKQNVRKLLFTILVWDSEPIRLLESPRLLSVNILHMKNCLIAVRSTQRINITNWSIINQPFAKVPALHWVLLY